MDICLSCGHEKDKHGPICVKAILNGLVCGCPAFSGLPVAIDTSDYVRVEAILEYRRHCSKIGYLPAEVTLLLVGFTDGWHKARGIALPVGDYVEDDASDDREG